MRSVTRTAVIGLCILAASGAISAAHAQREARADRDVERPRLERLADFLELSDQQIDQLKALREENLSQMADLRKEMARARNAMRGEMLEEQPSIEKLKKIVADKSRIRTEMEIARLEHRLAMRGILTEEQLDKTTMLRGRGFRDGFRDGMGGARRGFRGGRMGQGRGMRCDLGPLGPGAEGEMGPGMGPEMGADEMGPGMGPGMGPDCPDREWDCFGPCWQLLDDE